MALASDALRIPGAKSDVIDAIGQTPLIRLNHVTQGLASAVYVKLESLNPGGSMKDRIALSIIEDAESKGLLQPGGTIIEATSGNTGAGLAMIAAVRGYNCIFVMPDKMSKEKIDALRAYGAKVVVCPTAVEPEDPRSYYSVAKRLVQETPGAFHANQYHNPANPEGHFKSTGPELWAQCNGEFDVFVAGMGTGGTLSGCGRYFKSKRESIQIVGVDPVGSIYYEYLKTGRMTQAFSYRVEGIGEDFLPSTMDLSILDDCVQVDDRECFLMTRELVQREGLFVGGSAGAAVAGAIKYARTLAEPKRIVVLLPDSAQKYLSKIFNDEWMRAHGFDMAAGTEGTVASIMARRPQEVITATAKEKVRAVVARMKKHSISQLPVIDASGRHCGVLSERDVLNYLVEHEDGLEKSIDELIQSNYATVTPQTKIELLRNVLRSTDVVLVIDNGLLCGVLTRIDLIDYLAKGQNSGMAA